MSNKKYIFAKKGWNWIFKKVLKNFGQFNFFSYLYIVRNFRKYFQ